MTYFGEKDINITQSQRGIAASLLSFLKPRFASRLRERATSSIRMEAGATSFQL